MIFKLKPKSAWNGLWRLPSGCDSPYQENILSEFVIQTRDLTKSYGVFTAVNKLNLSVIKGETYGFLGPNGAGKTTTLMMMMGIVKPTSGKVLVFGLPLSSDSFLIKRKLGVMSENLSFYEDLSAWEYLRFFGNLYEVENAEKRARQLLERVNLWQYRNVLLGGYSTGMQRKLSFVRAILHSPEILILDEPVSGLDPFGIVQIREIIKEEHALGHTIFISSHILSEIERTANRVGIISGGRLVFEDNMDRLRQQVSSTRSIELDLVDNRPEILEALRKLPFVLDIRLDEHLIQIDTLGDNDYRAQLGQALVQMGAVIQGMRAIETSLEEAFITLTEKSIVSLTQAAANLEKRDAGNGQQ
jgi:ABC-type multidrug transport system ATPase subunit